MNGQSQDRAVEALFSDYEGLRSDLKGLPSALAAINRIYHKHLLVAAASSLEDMTKQHVEKIFTKHGNEQLGEFVAKQVMARGYHTLFNWKDQTAQGFFTSFGRDRGDAFKAALRNDENLRDQHAAFMELGNLRNQVVHNNFADYSIDLTPEEVYQRYGLGRTFVSSFEDLIF